MLGFFASLARMVRTLFGLADGTTERATDALLSASPEAVRSQFRKTRDGWVKDYNDMREAIAELSKIHADKSEEAAGLNRRSADLTQKMAGAIDLYKKNKDESLREAYGRFAAERETNDVRVAELRREIGEEETLLGQYKARLEVLRENIDKLKEEEAQTVADLVSSRKIVELNDKLAGLSQDLQAKNLGAIRDARKKAVASAKLSAELSGSDRLDTENRLLEAGAASGHLAAFDEAVKVEALFAAEARLLPAPQDRNGSVQTSADTVDALFRG